MANALKHGLKAYETRWLKQGLNRAHRRQWGDPRDANLHRQRTDVLWGYGVVSGGSL